MRDRCVVWLTAVARHLQADESRGEQLARRQQSQPARPRHRSRALADSIGECEVDRVGSRLPSIAGSSVPGNVSTSRTSRTSRGSVELLAHAE